MNLNKKNSLSLSLQFANSDDILNQKISRYKIVKWLKYSLNKDAEITVRIVDEIEGKILNKTYRNKDYATNVLTFDYQKEPTVLADIIICSFVIKKEAEEQNKTLESHLAHMIIHGSLHAQGFDHKNEIEAQIMEAEEIKIMQKLGFSNPYLD